jgi:hypothetical protein
MSLVAVSLPGLREQNQRRRVRRLQAECEVSSALSSASLPIARLVGHLRIAVTSLPPAFTTPF